MANQPEQQWRVGLEGLVRAKRLIYIPKHQAKTEKRVLALVERELQEFPSIGWWLGNQTSWQSYETTAVEIVTLVDTGAYRSDEEQELLEYFGEPRRDQSAA